jgi:hypothetical protein
VHLQKLGTERGNSLQRWKIQGRGAPPRGTPISSLWRDVRTRVELNCCLDCQAKNDETGFGGWPKQLEDIPLAPQGFMAAEHRMCIATHCSIDHTWNKGIRFGSLTFPPRENSRRRTNMNT